MCKENLRIEKLRELWGSNPWSSGPWKEMEKTSERNEKTHQNSSHLIIDLK